MNPEIKTTEYVAKLKDIQLSDSARVRIETNLHEYASFHTVADNDTSSSRGGVLARKSLFFSKFVSAPLIILLAIMIAGGTTLAAQASIPGDVLYPVKIIVNENVRVVLAVQADSKAKLQAEFLEERLKEAQKLQVEGRLTVETAALVVTNISIQTKRAQAALDNSSNPVQVETKAKIALALKNFLGSTTLDSNLVAEIPTTFFESDQTVGEYDVKEHQAEMKTRTEALAKLMKKYQSKLDVKVYADLVAKQDSVLTLITQAGTQSKADAQVTLDKATKLAGEIASKLSTLVKIKIDNSTGSSTDFDVVTDPNKIDDNWEGTTYTTSAASTPGATGGSKGTSTKIDGSGNGSVKTDVIDVPVDMGVGSSTNLGL